MAFHFWKSLSLAVWLPNNNMIPVFHHSLSIGMCCRVVCHNNINVIFCSSSSFFTHNKAEAAAAIESYSFSPCSTLSSHVPRFIPNHRIWMQTSGQKNTFRGYHEDYATGTHSVMSFRECFMRLLCALHSRPAKDGKLFLCVVLVFFRPNTHTHSSAATFSAYGIHEDPKD